MTYRPPTVKSGSFGEWVTAKVRKHPSRSGFVQLKIKDSNSPPLAISRKNVPDNFFPGLHQIRISDDKRKILSFRPYQGMYKVQFANFASRRDSKPAPKLVERENKEGQSYSYQQFVAILDVIDGKYKGCTIPHVLRYNFKKAAQEIDGEEKEVVGLPQSGKGRHADALIEFMDIFGAWVAGSIPASALDNLLPGLEKRLQHEARTPSVILKDGWIDTLYADRTPDEEPDF